MILIMLGIGSHQRVSFYGVPAIQRSANQRFGATCRDCGTWRGPSVQAVYEALTSIPCRPRPHDDLDDSGFGATPRTAERVLAAACAE